MKKLLSSKALLTAALVVLLPSFATANSIAWEGTLAPYETDIYGFQVTTAGNFRVSGLAGFFAQIATNAGGFDDGEYLATFTKTLGIGSYLVGIRNGGALVGPFASDHYILGINSTLLSRGEVAKVPEPSSLMLLAAGLLGLGLLRRRRQPA